MIAPEVQRLASAHLEDLAYIILTARADGTGFELYPDLDDDVRARLRSRIKQISRYDWPSSLREDPALRRGHTLFQCCRLAVALLLLDAHLPPSLVFLLAQNNERGFFATMAARLAEPDRRVAAPTDPVAVILPGEIQDALGAATWTQVEPTRVRFVARGELGSLWSDDLAGPAARLIVDAPAAAAALWRWISNRRLMDDTARLALLAETRSDEGKPHFQPVAERKLRR